MLIRTILSIFLISILSLSSVAQKTVSSSEIIKLVNQGKDVTMENVTIRGVLDLTNLTNRKQTKESGWFSGGSDQYESTVVGKLVFRNCTFSDDVIAYYNEDNTTYIAHFEDDVVFNNCKFEEKSEFKYSEFPELADFSNSEFEREANFKYAEFRRDPDFTNCKFEEEANFKYAEFRGRPSYAGAYFDDKANFKYTEFPRGVTFENAVFDDMADFKYAKFSNPLNIKNVTFNGDEDFKYTSINGKSFTSYLLENR